MAGQHESPHEIAAIERQLECCWREMIEAERRGASAGALERRYASYVRLLDAYVRAQRLTSGRQPRSRLAS